MVDNGSTDNPKVEIETAYPAVQFIRSETNLGFAGGNNLAMQVAKGDYWLLINNDTTVTPDLLDQLLAVFERYPKAGVVCPKICYDEPPNRIQFVGYTRMNAFTARNQTLGQYELDNGQYTTIRPTAYAHGAAMMIKREVVERVGLMPELFFLYYEELDWSEQIRRAGYELYVEPNACIFHKELMATGKNSPLKTYYINRNRILFMRRHSTALCFGLFLLYTVGVVIPKNLLYFLLKGEKKHFQAFVKAFAWHLQHLRLKKEVHLTLHPPPSINQLAALSGVQPIESGL